MYEYGNARIAALRGRLLDGPTLRRLQEAESAAELLVLLERAEDWRPILREVAPLAADPQSAFEVSVERHRSARLGALPRWYPPPARDLVDALVLPLDAQRVVALLRRRRAGETPEAVGATIVGGALLGTAQLGAVGRAPTFEAAVRLLTRLGVVPADAVASFRGAEAAGGGWEPLEAGLVAAFDGARVARAAGRGGDAARVRAIIAAERADRETVVGELRGEGASAAAHVERETTLARLDRLAAAGPRDPLGIGAVAGYVAAVEAQAIRLRAILARVAAGWSGQLVGTYMTARTT
jgi:vacuolar-type H+-ATPase subunit C/Vma6